MHLDFDRWRGRTQLVTDTCIHSRAWLGQPLWQLQRAACADPRDRVYGILGILPFEPRRLRERFGRTIGNLW